MKKRILIVCTGNSCRSQIAEGFWRHYGGERWDVYSAGIMPVGVNLLAIRAMAEVGIDISGHRSQGIEQFLDERFDLVITVCAKADERCPVFPGGGRKEHWPFDDPIEAASDEEQRMREFRRVRDEIGARIRQWLAQEK